MHKKSKTALVLVSSVALNTHNLSIMQIYMEDSIQAKIVAFFSYSLINIKINICVGKEDRKYTSQCYQC